MSCSLGHLDGAYVLGALSPAERRTFEQHLDGCSTCTRAVGGLAGLPGLLARVDPEALEALVPGVPGGSPGTDDVPVTAPPDTLLPALVRDVRRTQRRRTLMTAGLAAAAAVLVAGSALGVGVATGVVGGPTATTAGPPSVVAPAGTPMVPLGYAPMQARVAFAPVAWGTRLDLACSYAAASDGRPATYVLVVRTRDGRTEQVATWRGLPGRTMRLSAATAARAADISSVEVRTSDGRAVLELAT